MFQEMGSKKPRYVGRLYGDGGGGGDHDHQDADVDNNGNARENKNDDNVITMCKNFKPS